MSGAGDLDRRITLQRATMVNDPDYNSEEPTWTPYATVWAKMEFHGSSEGEGASREYAEMGLYFTIRWRADMSFTDRLLFKNGEGTDETYEIVGRPREIGRRRYLKMQARLIE
ncbi:MAG: head-tail adaptor protein [Mesorhizobium sp.]|uniref:phage head closure protein n=1 Tax=Mesorhizobium sp. M7A.F.Ca.ET.027.02.1.1 TaxID=2496655 RepID=UPI000FD53759|nr:phage head closure protein [Mesorhizobium sp. M7A.F.Ca.ET.027.02.1.1]RVD16866.1 head-tail adaptor protein [Mesorhizobium sp. M7A.F.Ca.ET.027.02.1.1]RWD00504.1 MAG: head-tail adaptor protein [Mesorhizobium sp.]